jgi:recombination protein RecT
MQSNQQIATQQPSTFELELQSYEPQFAAALPSHISVEKFRRTVITALNAQPDLVRADRRSLFTACVRAAQDGLFPDGREAALVIFNTKNQKTGEWRKLVQYLPMVGGLIKRMRNSGELAAISSYVVFSNDAFDYELGDDPHINHKPAMGDRGQPVGVYAVAKLTNGEVLREVMSVSEVEKVRAVSKSRDKGYPAPSEAPSIFGRDRRNAPARGRAIPAATEWCRYSDCPADAGHVLTSDHRRAA